MGYHPITLISHNNAMWSEYYIVMSYRELIIVTNNVTRRTNKIQKIQNTLLNNIK